MSYLFLFAPIPPIFYFFFFTLHTILFKLMSTYPPHVFLPSGVLALRVVAKVLSHSFEARDWLMDSRLCASLIV